MSAATTTTAVPILLGSLLTLFVATLYRGKQTQAQNQKKSHDDDDDYDDASKKQEHENTGVVTLSLLPDWLIQKLPEYRNMSYNSDEDRMALAIEISKLNVENQTGGPFGCVIFRRDHQSFKLISVGLNRVVPLNNSTLHGEMIAIQMAQRFVGNYTLSSNHHYELYTSCEPCCMCLGASLWSGVSRVVCGATKTDASAIGFDEGPVFEKSYEHLICAGIEVKREVMRDEAAAILNMYSRQGLIYNR